ncbi:hypothetical protein PH586_14270 [Pseudomonas sp. SA3-5]|uniref:Uncharacterized protein n=1 Tax=Pseudomonas aestuarii TaxID=3018340 RepID=A0ABT4XH57_9PSED|nr:hypothetical protein [Pseudomonas aestuarii]MDA7087551.1 hypothetical protein [Pseudomonas aestuarii]
MNLSAFFRSALVLSVLVIVGASPLCLAGTTDEKATLTEVKQDTQDLMHAIKGYSIEQRDEAITQTRSALDKMDRRISQLENRVDKRWDTMSVASRQKARATLQTLRQKRIALAEWYGGMKSSTADAWEEMKSGFVDAYSVLGDAWQDAQEQFESAD